MGVKGAVPPFIDSTCSAGDCLPVRWSGLLAAALAGDGCPSLLAVLPRLALGDGVGDSKAIFGPECFGLADCACFGRAVAPVASCGFRGHLVFLRRACVAGFTDRTPPSACGVEKRTCIGGVIAWSAGLFDCWLVCAAPTS